MKILILNGSPRPQGNTAAMVDAFIRGAKDAGNQIDVFSVCHMKIAGCLGCVIPKETATVYRRMICRRFIRTLSRQI